MVELFKHCQFTLTEKVPENDYVLLKNLTGLGFKIVSLQPFVIERASTTEDAILNLIDLLSSHIILHASSVDTTTEKGQENRALRDSQNLSTDTEEKEQRVDMIDAGRKAGLISGKENSKSEASGALIEAAVLQPEAGNFYEDTSAASNERNDKQIYIQDGICFCPGLDSDIKVQIYRSDDMSTLEGVNAIVSFESLPEARAHSPFEKKLEMSTGLMWKDNATEITVTKDTDLLVPFTLHITKPMQDLQVVRAAGIDDIRQMALQCLIKAGSQGFSSLAFSSVMAGVSESLPLQKCCKSYMEAVKHFDAYKKKWENPLQEIHLTDTDDKVIKFIQTCFMEEWKKPRDELSCSADFEFSDRLLDLQENSDYESEQSEDFNSSFAKLEASSKEAHTNHTEILLHDQNQQTPYGQVKQTCNNDRSRNPSAKETDTECEASADEEEVCPICAQSIEGLLKLPCCKELLCSTCKMKVQTCPYCRKAFGILRGDQPDGEMNVQYLYYDFADGYENSKAWEIEYVFPSGCQKAYHPTPGKVYPSVRRKAYLPATDEGFRVLLLLRLAFIRRLTFTIGTSVTMKKDNVITWNDIHHKTSLHGGTYGFPDPGYLKRVEEELDSREVRLEAMTRDENEAIQKFADMLNKSYGLNTS